MIKTFRHNYDEIFKGKFISCPRMFIDNERSEKYGVHILDWNCQYVFIFLYVGDYPIGKITNSTFMPNCKLKLYSNSKGSFFIWNRWISNTEKKSERVYLCA